MGWWEEVVDGFVGVRWEVRLVRALALTVFGL